MKRSFLVGRAPASVDWDATEILAARCGGHAAGLVRVRNTAGLASWLPRASRNVRRVAPVTAELYDELLELVAVARDERAGKPRRVEGAA
jgi:hypothetical protein